MRQSCSGDPKFQPCLWGAQLVGSRYNIPHRGHHVLALSGQAQPGVAGEVHHRARCDTYNLAENPSRSLLMHVEGEREESKVASPLKSLHMLQSNWQENTIHPGPVQALPGDTGKGWTHPEMRELTIQYLGPARGQMQLEGES